MDFCRSACALPFPSAAAAVPVDCEPVSKSGEGRRGCERARIWARRKLAFRSIIVGGFADMFCMSFFSFGRRVVVFEWYFVGFGGSCGCGFLGVCEDLAWKNG